MPLSRINAARWLVLAWLCLAQSILPTKQVHAHEGGEVLHSRYERHRDQCTDGEGLPGRHAHFLILGCECHVPLPPYDEPPGFSEEDAFAVMPAEQADLAADAVSADVAVIALCLPTLASEIAPAHSWSADLPPPLLHPSGKTCRLLYVSLTL
jgi:hypothetical protein